MIKNALLAVAAITTLAAAPAFAADVSVTYKDLDLATAEGKATLAKRIDAAARQACGYGEQVTGSRLASREATACYKQARSRSNQTMLAIIDSARQGG